MTPDELLDTLGPLYATAKTGHGENLLPFIQAFVDAWPDIERHLRRLADIDEAAEWSQP